MTHFQNQTQISRSTFKVSFDLVTFDGVLTVDQGGEQRDHRIRGSRIVSADTNEVIL